MTLTLTKIVLSPRSRTVNLDLGDADAMHRRLMSLLPDSPSSTPRADAHLLYRVEETSYGVHLLVQSAHDLDLAALPLGYALTTRTLHMDALLERLAEGTATRYSVVVNPTIARMDVTSGKSRGLRRALTDEADISAWWLRRSAQAGLGIDRSAVQYDTLTPVTGKRTAKSGEASPGATDSVHHHAVRIEGRATISAVTALRSALVNGIGAGKSYGLGLLLVVPGQ